MSILEAFHDVRFPDRIAFGASGGPVRPVEVTELVSGHEKRNARRARSRRRFDAGTGVRSVADLREIIAFFEARRGALHAFRFRDPFDFKSCPPDAAAAPFDQVIGTGDGTTTEFRLSKTYGEGPQAYRRKITRPVSGTVSVAVAGQVLGPELVLVGDVGGTVTLSSPPAAGAQVTAGFEFDTPVRFAADELTLSLSGFEAGVIPAIPMIEVLE